MLMQSFNAIPLPAFAIDNEHNIIFLNNAFEKLMGIMQKDILGLSNYRSEKRPFLANLLLDGTKEDFLKYYNLNKDEIVNSCKAESWLLTKNKELKYISCEAHLLYGENGEVIGAFECMKDLTENRFTDDKLKMHYSVFDVVSEGIIISDENNKILFINNAMTQMSGFSLEEAIGQIPYELFASKKIKQNFFHNGWTNLKTEGRWKGEFYNTTKDGRDYRVKAQVSKIILESGDINYIGLVSNINEQKKMLEQLDFMAHYDDITKLPNRTFLEQKINAAMKVCEKNNTKCAVIFLDLDKFKNVNDSLGHDIGDILLREIGKRLKKYARKEDTVAHQGGDEFVILLENISDEEEVVSLAKEIKKVFDKSFKIKNHKISVTASIGISIYPIGGKTANDLLKNADTSMYFIKGKSKGDISIYTEEMNQHIIENIKIIDKLNYALPKDLNVYFQPQYCSTTKKIIGAEALIRWLDDELGWVRPDKFIPLAEEFGLIKPIGRFVLNKSCEVIKETGLKVAVNISPIQLMDEDLEKDIDKAIKKHKIDPSLLTLEITEGAFISNFEAVKSVLNKIKLLGIKLALDDFGTGYSSLSYLSQLPFDYLKIDQSFIKNQDNLILVSSIIDMAKKLNLTTIAEGIETLEQLNLLRHNGCNIIQGYFYSKPLTLEKLREFIHPEHKASEFMEGI